MTVEPARREVKVKVLPHAADLPLPNYATLLAAGCDLRAAVDSPVVLGPGERALVPTGLCVALPADCELQIRPRSGLAVRHGVTVLNAPGTIDADYRGEIQVPLINLGHDPFTVARGERIAQAVLAPVLRVVWDRVEVLEDTSRGESGFGSTGRA